MQGLLSLEIFKEHDMHGRSSMLAIWVFIPTAAANSALGS
jgi:hypothetical protein